MAPHVGIVLGYSYSVNIAEPEIRKSNFDDLCEIGPRDFMIVPENLLSNDMIFFLFDGPFLEAKDERLRDTVDQIVANFNEQKISHSVRVQLS
jgi:hypothetical protein